MTFGVEEALWKGISGVVRGFGPAAMLAQYGYRNSKKATQEKLKIQLCWVSCFALEIRETQCHISRGPSWRSNHPRP